MKRILIFSFITFFLYAGMRAQSVGIDEVLHRIDCLLYTSDAADE